MTTFSFTGFSISYDTNDDPVSVGSASLAATFQDDQAVLNYSVLATEAGEVPDVDLGGTDALGATINGAPINDDADEFLGSVQSAEGTHVIMGFFDPATN